MKLYKSSLSSIELQAFFILTAVFLGSCSTSHQYTSYTDGIYDDTYSEAKTNEYKSDKYLFSNAISEMGVFPQDSTKINIQATEIHYHVNNSPFWNSYDYYGYNSFYNYYYNPYRFPIYYSPYYHHPWNYPRYNYYPYSRNTRYGRRDSYNTRTSKKRNYNTFEQNNRNSYNSYPRHTQQATKVNSTYSNTKRTPNNNHNSYNNYSTSTNNSKRNNSPSTSIQNTSRRYSNSSYRTSSKRR